MKYLSRILILALALAAVLSCFVACDGGEASEDTTAPAEGEIGDIILEEIAPATYAVIDDYRDMVLSLI